MCCCLYVETINVNLQSVLCLDVFGSLYQRIQRLVIESLLDPQSSVLDWSILTDFIQIMNQPTHCLALQFAIENAKVIQIYLLDSVIFEETSDYVRQQFVCQLWCQLYGA